MTKPETKYITVITSAYNAEKTLEHTILSVREQTYPHFEYLIIDHGSTDGTREIIQKQCSEDSRLHLITIEKNTGFIGKALNTGIHQASGEYICFLDADDIYQRDFFENMLESVLFHKSDVGICGFSFYSEREGKIVKTFVQENRQIITYEDYQAYFREQMGKEMFFSYIDYYWNKFYRTEYLKENNLFFPETMFWLSDARFNLDILKTAPRISIVAVVGTVFTISDKSTTSSWKMGLKEEYLDYAYRWVEYLIGFISENMILESMSRYMPCLNDFYKLAGAKDSQNDIIHELVSWVDENREFYIKLLKAAKYDRKYLNNIELAMMKIKNKHGSIKCENSIYLTYYNKYIFREDCEKYLPEIFQLIWHEDNIFSLGAQELADMIL